MIELPDKTKAFEYENNFHLSCEISRISKLLAHYELYKMVKDLPGAVVECGVFKGVSLAYFAALRDLFGNSFSHKIIAFDVFGTFPETAFFEDKKYRENFVKNAGDQSISKNQLLEVLSNKGVGKNVELVEGDITKTVPEYIFDNPHLKISLLNLDTDIYEPSVTILENLWPRIVRGGILILDDYGTFPGETKAVDDYFKDIDVVIKKFSFAMTPCYIHKL